MHDSAITFNDISVGYGKNNIINSLTDNIAIGKITTIIGPNGSGKSTLLKSFANLLKLRSGSIKLIDKEMSELNQKEIAKRIAVLLQQNNCPHDITVEKLISIGRMPHKRWYELSNCGDKKIVEKALRDVGIEYMKDKIICHLSGGERQRVWLAMALAQETDILLLDEPTTYLDIAHQIDMLELIKRINLNTGITIIMVLHDLNQAFKYSDELIILKDGKIMDKGKPKKLASVKMLKEIYNVDADIMDIDGAPYIIPKKWRR